MDTFIYNKYVTGKHFIGRKQEVSILCNLLSQNENIVIYEPPRTGKTSLIQQAFFKMRVAGGQFSTVQMSLLNIRTVNEFLCRMGSTLLKAVGTTAEELEQQVTDFLQGTGFSFDAEDYSAKGQILALEGNPTDADIRAVCRLQWKLGERLEQKLIIVLDEFQNIMLTEDGDRVLRIFEKVLKELHSDQKRYSNIIFCGSQFNAMKDIFDIRRFFYRQVERVELGQMDTKEIVDSIVRTFLSSGKVLDRDMMTGVCALFHNHICYINHFASICDGLAKGYIMEPVLMDALEAMLTIHGPRFISIMNDLTTYQVSLLKALLDGYNKFSSSDVIRLYGLNSSANVRRVKDALIKKEIVTWDDEDSPRIIDPLFEYWAAKFYFEIK